MKENSYITEADIEGFKTFSNLIDRHSIPESYLKQAEATLNKHCVFSGDDRPPVPQEIKDAVHDLALKILQGEQGF